MFRFLINILLILLVGCHLQDEPVVVPAKVEWENTNIKLDGGHMLARGSYLSDGKVFVLLSGRLVEVDKSLNVRTVTSFDDPWYEPYPTFYKNAFDPWYDPYPTMYNGIFSFAELRSYLPPAGVGGSLRDTVTYYFVDTRSGAKGRINLTALRVETATTTSTTFNSHVAAINSQDRLLVSFKDYERGNLMGTLFSIQRSEGKLEFADRKVFVIAPLAKVDGMRSMYAIGEHFYVSTYDESYKIDGDGNVSLLGKSLAGEPFFFNGKWNIFISNEGTLVSSDGNNWSKTNELKYNVNWSLGVQDSKYFYITDDDRYCKRAVFSSTDLKTIHPFKIDNDAALCIKRLNVMDGYLYGLDPELVLYRVKLGRDNKPD